MSNALDSLNPIGTALAGSSASAEKAAELLRLASSGPDAARAEKAAKGFEAVLTEQMLQEAHKTVEKSGLFDDPAGEQMDDMFWSMLARQVGEKGSLGLWKDIYRDICRRSGISPSAAPAAPGAAPPAAASSGKGQGGLEYTR